MDANLTVRVLEMFADGSGTNPSGPADRICRHSRGHEAENLNFRGRQSTHRLGGLYLRCGGSARGECGVQRGKHWLYSGRSPHIGVVKVLAAPVQGVGDAGAAWVYL